MQIHEITIQEGLGAEIAKSIGRTARDQLLQRTTGVSNLYQKATMKDRVDPAPVTGATTSLPATPNSRTAGAKSGAAAAAKKGRAAPAVDPATPVVYRFDGRSLNPANPSDARTIKTLQAAGVTSATSGIDKTK